MRLNYAVYFIGVIYVLYQAGRGARGQDINDPNLVFENITFDMVNLGSYNISHCVEELINCWEIIKPDIICMDMWKYHSSMCSTTREHCAEFYGDESWTPSGFIWNEQSCWTWYMLYTT